MLITYMYMPTDTYYYILDLSPLFLGCLIGYLRPMQCLINIAN